MHPHGSCMAHALEHPFHGIKPVLELEVPIPYGADQAAQSRPPPDPACSQVVDDTVDTVLRIGGVPRRSRDFLRVEDPTFTYSEKIQIHGDSCREAKADTRLSPARERAGPDG